MMRNIVLIYTVLIVLILPISAQKASEFIPITQETVGQLHEITSFSWTDENTTGTTARWNPENGRVLIHEFRGNGSEYAPTLTIWDSLNDEVIFQLQPEYRSYTYSAYWNEAGSLLLISQQKDDETGVDLALWSIDTGERIAEFEIAIPEYMNRHQVLWLDDQIYVSVSTLNWGARKNEDSVGTYLSVFDTEGNLINASTSEWLSSYLIPSPDESRILAFMETAIPGQSPIVFDRDGNVIAELNQPASDTLEYNPYAVWSADSRRILTFNYYNTARYSNIWSDAGDPRLWSNDGELITEITTPYEDYRDGLLWNDDLTHFLLWNATSRPDASFFTRMVNDMNEILFELPENSTLNNEESDLLNVMWNPDQSLLFLWQYPAGGQRLLEIWSADGEYILQTDREFGDLTSAIWSADNHHFLLPIEQFSRDCILENVVLEVWDTQDFTRPQARMLYTGFLDAFWNADGSLIYGRVDRGFISEGCSFSPEREFVIWSNEGDRLFEASLSVTGVELNADETQLFVHTTDSVAIWGVIGD